MMKKCDCKKLTSGKKQYFICSIFNAFMYNRDRRSFSKFYEEHVCPLEKEEIRKNYTINILLIIRYLAKVENDTTILDLLYTFDAGDFNLITKPISTIIETDKHISIASARQLEEIQDICIDYIRNKDTYKHRDEDEILF